MSSAAHPGEGPPGATPPQRWRITVPIGTKIFLMLTVVLAAAVGVVTWTAIESYREDKAAYVFDLSTQVAQNTARAVDLSIQQLSETMQVFASVLDAPDIGPVEKSGLLKGLFAEFPAVSLLSIYEAGESRIQVFNPGKLARQGVTKEQILARRSALFSAADAIEPGSVLLRNSTLDAGQPMLMLAIPHKADPSQIIVADVDQERIFDAAQSEGSEGGATQRYVTWLVDGAGRLVVHPDVERGQRGEDVSRLQIVQTMLGSPLPGAQEFVDERGRPMLGAFARVPTGELGVVVQVPRAQAFRAARTLVRSAVLSALGVVALALLFGLLFARTLTRPIEKLGRATEAIAQGRFETPIELRSRDEIGELGVAIATMAQQLRRREEELQDAQMQLVQSEKMAAFGQMSAGIAHEVKNPLAGILGSAQLAKVFYPKGKPIEKFLSTIEVETKRCRDIVDNLLRFARQEKAELSSVHVNEVIERTVALVSHQIGIKRIRLEVERCEDPPPLHGNANQLEQVLMNLLLNAADAIEDARPNPESSPDGKRGVISLRCESEQHGVRIEVQDDGPGIPEEVRERIFEPFFTTKPVGKGTGLGLSVSYGIIQDHGGQISVHNRAEGGARFVIRLPAEDRRREDAEGVEAPTGL